MITLNRMSFLCPTLWEVVVYLKSGLRKEKREIRLIIEESQQCVCCSSHFGETETSPIGISRGQELEYLSVSFYYWFRSVPKGC